MEQVQTNGHVNGQVRPRVVIIGGGFAGVNVAQQLDKILPKNTADIHLISSDNFFLASWIT